MLTIGIVNSMPETAIRSTERQFGDLLSEAADSMPFRIKWFSLRSRENYEAVEDLWGADYLDGLIVTGTEPRARLLSDEPYWGRLTRTVEWAAAHTGSAIFSCLGAHAAVLHLDGVERTACPVKLSGVFDSITVAQHPLLANVAPIYSVPHSRFNDLMLSDLATRDYQMLSLSEAAGVDIFVKTFHKSMFVFLQSHPEYDGRALMREYRREVLRFLTGERPTYPDMPMNYFDQETSAGFAALRDRAMLDYNPDTMVEFQMLVGRAELSGSWSSTAIRLYRNWFSLLTTARKNRVLQAAL